MLYYSINSLDALDKLKEANCYALKEAKRMASRPITFNPYDFF